MSLLNLGSGDPRRAADELDALVDAKLVGAAVQPALPENAANTAMLDNLLALASATPMRPDFIAELEARLLSQNSAQAEDVAEQIPLYHPLAPQAAPPKKPRNWFARLPWGALRMAGATAVLLALVVAAALFATMLPNDTRLGAKPGQPTPTLDLTQLALDRSKLPVAEQTRLALMPTPTPNPAPLAGPPVHISLVAEVAAPNTSGSGATQIDDALLQRTRDLLLARLSQLDVASFSVNYTQTVGAGAQISVSVVTSRDPVEISRLLLATGHLEFIDSGNTPLAVGGQVCTSSGCPNNMPMFSLAPSAGANEASPTPTPALPPTPAATYPTILDDSYFDRANIQVTNDMVSGVPLLAFNLIGDGPGKLANFTTANVGNYMPVVLDKVVVYSPVIQGEITGGQGVISNISWQQANDIALLLRSGEMPVTFSTVQITTADPAAPTAPPSSSR